jgi:hypothetical protein
MLLVRLTGSNANVPSAASHEEPVIMMSLYGVVVVCIAVIVAYLFLGHFQPLRPCGRFG